MIGGFAAILRRELSALTATPVAAVFVAAFVAASTLFGIQVGGLFEAGRAELDAVVQFHPWLLTVLAPALAMRSWAEDVRGGTLETLLALPVPLWIQVAAKFCASWLVAGVALLLATPVWIGIALLGPVDHAATAVAWLGSWLVAGAGLAIGSWASAMTSSQSMAFVLGTIITFLFLAAGLPIVADTVAAVAGPAAGEVLAGLSILDRLASLQGGVIDARSLVYFISLTGLFLSLAVLALDSRRGGRLR